jgi:hypothetical protein
MRKLLTTTAAVLLAGSLTAAAQQTKDPTGPQQSPETGMPSDKGDRAGGSPGMSTRGSGTTGQGSIGAAPKGQQDPHGSLQPGGNPAVEPPASTEPASPAPTR